ncbi:hypothetical protein [Cellulomonas sp. P5_E12]
MRNATMLRVLVAVTAVAVLLVSSGCGKVRPASVEAMVDDIFRAGRQAGDDVEINAYGMTTKIPATEVETAQQQTVRTVNIWLTFASENKDGIMDAACMLTDSPETLADLSAGFDVPELAHLTATAKAAAQNIATDMNLRKATGAGLAAVQAACDLADATEGL